MLDEVLAGLTADALSEEAGKLLAPLLDALEQADDFDGALALLDKAYPQLDSTLMEERLGQLLYAAELLGRVSVQQDIEEEKRNA